MDEFLGPKEMQFTTESQRSQRLEF
jgi:hypothetical protein